ncbi:HNH endonuclease [Pseudomonas sp. GZJR-8]|uniref:HNH endonuclease n=1 Tax=Pseudomonas sp. GZJR-8 TaxID=1395925 RepID=UPI000CDA7575|nr:HNH endonuclease [Pseudomonas sp. GZJR-8]
MSMDSELLRLARSVTQKRPKTVIDHIIKYGFITTDDLKDTYGYIHPPRAIRDVREQGIPVETYRVAGKDGRSIAAYRFGDPEKVEGHKLGGRKTFSKAFKADLVDYYGERCMISSERYDERYLQIDHRIPYEVSGDLIGSEGDVSKFMLLSGTAQRKKSWSCEHCQNLTDFRDYSVCASCYWASPEKYTHVAMKQERQVTLTFSGDHLALFDKLRADADINLSPIQELIFKKLNSAD